MDCCESHEATIQLNLWGVLHFWGCLGCSLLDLDVTVAWGFSFVTIEVHNFAPVTSPSCWISFLLNLFIRKHFPSQHNSYSHACHPIHPWKERGLKKSPDCGWTGLNDWVDLGWTSHGFKLKYNSPIKELNFTHVINGKNHLLSVDVVLSY